MSDPRDTGPLAPRRSLGQAATSGDAATQPVMAPPYGANPQPYASPAEAERGRTLPVPPLPEDQDAPHGRPGKPPVNRKAERVSRRALANRPRTIRRARLKMMRIDPWSVTKVALLLSIAFGIMCVVAVFLLFSIMNAAGLWEHVNESIQVVVGQEPGEEFDITEYVGMDRVMGIAMLIAAVDVVLITALATLGAFIYNMSASLLGGVEVTLAEDVHR